MDKRELMKEKIVAHGERINAIFGTNHDPATLCRALRRLESQMHKAAEDWCNGDYNEVDYDEAKEEILWKVEKLLNFSAQGIPVFVNSDLRGCALKIEDDYIRDHNIDIMRDWGGYGLIAPDLSEV